MAPKMPLVSTLRQGMSAVKKSAAPLSTTASSKLLKELNVMRHSPPSKSPSKSSTSSSSWTSSILNVDTPGPSKDSTAYATKIFSMLTERTRGTSQRQQIEDEMSDRHRHDDHMRHLTRRWHHGDVYSPHDMSPSEMNKWRRPTMQKRDVVDLLGLRPVDLYRNFSIISEFMTPHGRIKRAAETGLRPVNQRKMAKAIRRAIGLGLHPSVHRHPEFLMRMAIRTSAQIIPRDSNRTSSYSDI
ncbi:ribosomal protein S18 [Xylaria nigripes]|nr:ribosomal protein S18 [Xylaria nigripes]